MENGQNEIDSEMKLLQKWSQKNGTVRLLIFDLIRAVRYMIHTVVLFSLSRFICLLQNGTSIGYDP